MSGAIIGLQVMRCEKTEEKFNVLFGSGYIQFRARRKAVNKKHARRNSLTTCKRKWLYVFVVKQRVRKLYLAKYWLDLIVLKGISGVGLQSDRGPQYLRS